MRRTALAMTMCLGVAASATAADLPAPKPTARDLYVSCYLFTHETDVPKAEGGKAELFSGTYCGLAAISMIANREGKDNPQKYKFCLDNGAATRTNVAQQMAYAYLDFYDGPALKDRNVDGPSAYLFAMMARWPCSSQ